MNRAIIEHDGVVKKVKDGKAIVSLSNVSSCGSCVVKPVCSVSDIDNKELEVDCRQMDFTIGEHIKVMFDQSMGPKAMLLGYFLPFVVLFLVLITAWQITHEEMVSAIAALVSLIPYYFTIWLLRERLKDTFAFKVRKLRDEL